jgi:hypothetical protein
MDNQSVYSAVRTEVFNLISINFDSSNVYVHQSLPKERHGTGHNTGPSYDQKTPHGDYDRTDSLLIKIWPWSPVGDRRQDRQTDYQLQSDLELVLKRLKAVRNFTDINYYWMSCRLVYIIRHMKIFFFRS